MGFAVQAVALTLGGVATVQPLLIAELPSSDGSSSGAEADRADEPDRDVRTEPRAPGYPAA